MKIKHLLVGCLVFWFAANSVYASDEIPLDDFIKSGDYLDIVISPDAKHYAARVRQNDRVMLAFIRLADGEIVGGVKPRKNNEVGRVYWVSNNRVVHTYAEKHHFLDTPIGTGELYAVDIDMSQNIRLAGFRAGGGRKDTRLNFQKSANSTFEFLNSLPNDPKHILVVEYPWTQDGRFYYDRRDKHPIVAKMNVFNGRISNKQRMPYPGAAVYASDEGKVHFVSYVDKAGDLKASFRKSEDEEWQDISVFLDEGFEEIAVVGINKAGTKVFLSGYEKGSDVRTLFELSLGTKKLVKLFDNQTQINNWFLDQNNEPVVGTSYDDKVRYHYFEQGRDSRTALTHRSLVNAFKGQEVDIISQDFSGKKLTIRVSSDINPGEYFVYDVDKKKAQFLWANLSWIDVAKMRPKMPFKFKARDGVEVQGYLTMPKIDKGAAAPGVILPHGGPHGVRDYPSFEREVQLLANRGFAVLQVNFRGSGGYTRSFGEMGYKKWGIEMVDDVIDATHWAIKQGYLDEKRLCTYGASYGGFSALMSVARAPDLFQCAIGYVGVYDLPEMLTSGDIPKLYSGKGYLDRVLGSDIEQLTQQSPAHNADKIKVPVFLIHGEEDQRAPEEQAKIMRKALKKAGNDPKWLMFGNAGHGVGNEKNRRKLYSELLSFLTEHTGSK